MYLVFPGLILQYNIFYSFFISIVIYEIWRLVDIMSCILYIVETLDEYLPIDLSRNSCLTIYYKRRCHGFHSVKFLVLATELFKTHYAV